MKINHHLNLLVSAVVKRSGICRATVEQVLPAVFDEIRYQLAEGKKRCVPIESFGTFGTKALPWRKHTYTYKGVTKTVIKEPTLRIKFLPTRNFRREIESGTFDPTRRSFYRHPKDPAIRRRKDIKYKPMKEGATIFKGQTMPLKDPSEDISQQEK